jgi:DegV family protein with EDD domain
MTSYGIITDSSVQFAQSNFPGSNAIRILHHQIEINGRAYSSQRELKIANFPHRISPDFQPRIIPFSIESLNESIASLLPQVDDLFIIVLSKELNPLFEQLADLSSKLHGRAHIHCIDSQNVSIGLGMIVQTASEMLAKGIPADDVEQHLRKLIPHVYMLLCAPNLSYLYLNGSIDYAQSVVGDMIDLLSIFTLEDGKLNPMEKVKNVRGALDYFIEFFDEFDEVKQITILQPAPPTLAELRLMHQHIEEVGSSATYSEYPINPFLATLVGPQAFGLGLMENLRR